VGETPEVAGFFIAAGLNSIGILTGGGIGRLVARWVRAMFAARAAALHCPTG
jgi:4-methylaminobutanoate oxidase (formaldehyde-forming)